MTRIIIEATDMGLEQDCSPAMEREACEPRVRPMASIDPHAVEKIGTTTPSTITPEILALCKALSPDHHPGFVRVIPDADAQISECFGNVLHRVERSGGQIRYGWSIWMWQRVFIEAEHHAVWDNGSHLLDVTPHATGESKILFLPDPTRTFDVETFQRIINVKRSLGVVPEAQRWIDANDRLSRYLEDNSVGTEYRIDRRTLAHHGSEIAHCKADLLIALAYRTRPHEPCICGGRLKFKACCRPFIKL